MKLWLEKLVQSFTGKQHVEVTHQPAAQARPDLPQHFDAMANADILSGWRYCATMQLRTPLGILQRHGEFAPLSKNGPPVISEVMWHGIWVPETKGSLDFLGAGATMASEVGPIPRDGGDYYHFLVAVREIAEGEGAIESKLGRIGSLVNQRGPEGTRYGDYHEAEALQEMIFPRILTLLPIPRSLAGRLAESGMDTLGAVENAGDQQLLAIHGLGAKSLVAMRQYLLSSGADRSAKRFIAEEFKPLEG